MSVSVVYADIPFRRQRYSSLQATPVARQNVVFVGNSITNMHPWAEAFNSQKVVGRGTSGALSGEILANVQSFITGRPEKLFLMVGTNDLGTQDIKNEEILWNIRQAIKHVQAESPRTRIFLQSVMPSTNGIRTLERIHEFNLQLKEMAKEANVEFIDNEPKLTGLATNELSFDRLHPHVFGNKIWCELLAPYVGKRIESLYPKSLPLLDGGMKDSHGARLSTMSQLAIRKKNVVFIGDDMIHNAEWHELLHNKRILNRGTGWGCWTSMDVTLRSIATVFRGLPENQTPRQIVVHTGRMELASSTADLAAVKQKYQQVIDSLRFYAPGAHITLMTVAPFGKENLAINRRNLAPFNAWIKELAGKEKDIDVADIYTALTDGNDLPRDNYMEGNYVMGLGILKVARTLAPGVKGCKVDAEAEAKFLLLGERLELSRAIDRAERTLSRTREAFPEGSNDVVYVRKALEEGYALLRDEKSSTKKMTEKAEEINAAQSRLSSKVAN